MKTAGKVCSFKPSAFLMTLALYSGVWTITGCWDKPAAPAAASSQATSPPKKETVVVEKTSFDEVTSHLDPGGSLFGYMSTAQWCQGLANTVDGWRDLALGLPMVGPQERAMITNVFALATPLIRKSGIEDLTGFGMSGIAIGNGLYRTKFIAHHYSGKDTGFLWKCAGKAPHALAGLKMLPADTVAAAFWDLDLAMLWDAIEQTANQSGVADARDALHSFATEFEKNTGLAWAPLLASLGDGYGVILTLDPERKITIPLPGTPLSLPEPGLVIVVQVKSEVLFDRVDKALKENPQTISVDKAGLKMRTLPLPIPLPINLRPTVARNGEFLYLASTEEALQRVLDAQSGKQPGLSGTEEFKTLSRGIALEGNQFVYISRRFGDSLGQAQAAMLQAGGAGGGPPAAMIQKMMNSMNSPQSFAVAGNDKDGWSMTGNGSQQPAGALLLPMVVAPASIVAAMVLPALSKAKERAVSIQCVNNLKQIGLAARLWANDHNGDYPVDFLSMTNELSSPRILICPAAKNSAQAGALKWSTLNASDITYQMVGAGGKDDPKTMGETLVRCPIHGHVCLRDGTVQQGTGK